MRHRVLLVHGHLRERLRRAIRNEDRIETESAAPALPLRNRSAALPVEDLVVVRSPQEEHRLEPSRTVSGPLQQLQDACTAEALVYVRRIHAREAAKLFDEESGVIDEVVPADLIVQDGRREPDDLLETVRLNLRIGTILVDQLDVGLAKLGRNLAELASFVVTKAIRCTDPATRSPSLSRSPRRPLSPSSGGTPGVLPDSTTRPVRARSRVPL